MNEQVSKAERDAEIVATCEAAVSHLMDPRAGWTQGAYTEGEVDDLDDYGDFRSDYTTAKACLGGAIVLTQNKVFVNAEPNWDYLRASGCPAVSAVAAVIREQNPELPINNMPDEDGSNYCESYDETTIYTFNDEPGRTVEDVIDVLNDTIKRHSSEVVDP